MLSCVLINLQILAKKNNFIQLLNPVYLPKPNLERARSDMNQIYQQLKTAPAAPKEKPRSSTYIGVVRTNPSDYANQFSDELVKSEDLPDFVKNIPTPEGIVLAADYKPRAVLELEGSLEGLAMIDLEKEGLAEYKSQLDEYLDALNKNKKKEEAKTAESGENVEVLSKASPSS